MTRNTRVWKKVGGKANFHQSGYCQPVRSPSARAWSATDESLHKREAHYPANIIR